MKTKKIKKKQKGIAERKTEVKRKFDIPYKAIGMGMLLWIVVTWLFFGHGVVSIPSLVEGQKAPAPISALVEFECENLTETELKRTAAADDVDPVFTIDPAPVELAVQKMGRLFDALEQYAAASTNERGAIEATLGELLTGSKIETSELIEVFPADTVAKTRRIILRGIKEVMRTGILSDEYRDTLFRDDPYRKLTIVTDDGASETSIGQRDTYSTRKAVWAVSDNISDSARRKLLDRLLPLFVVENMTYDKSVTEALRKDAADAVEPVIQQYAIGTPLIQAGEPATQQTVLLLQQHDQQLKSEQKLAERSMEILGNSILLMLGLIATAVILRVVNAVLIRQPEKILLMVILSLFTLGMARLLTYLSVQYSLISPSLLTYLVPHALAVLLAGILLGSGAAICLGFWCSFATAVLFEQSFSVFVLGMIITVTATGSMRNIHRRASLFRAGLSVCAVKLLYVLIMALLNPPGTSVLIGQAVAAVLSGMLATILTILLIPVFEKLFKITTDITLLELSDMGHPLLQKMAMQAPGTYHHSLMVATLAQNAAEAIGANSLLVRVCAYYHDIGKMAKPEFFTENIQHKENPHDELSPHMSALVISSHVKEGLTLARRHKLPPPVLDAIEQHHGNGLISYFYHKAKTLQGDGETTMADVINDSDFRYGGAPAVTPEMAILSLADASEAASRSIEKPTLQKITNMMDDIFAMKIRDGQMDYANLTMAQINVVKQSFIFSLSNMLHGRIPYPKDNEPKSSKPADNASDTAAKTPTAV